MFVALLLGKPRKFAPLRTHVLLGGIGFWAMATDTAAEHRTR